MGKGSGMYVREGGVSFVIHGSTGWSPSHQEFVQLPAEDKQNIGTAAAVASLIS